MKSKRIYNKITVSELVEQINLKKNQKKLNVAFVDQNFLKRTEQKFTSIRNQEFFLLEKKIGLIQKRAVVDVYLNTTRTTEYEIKTSVNDSSKSELSFPNYNFEEGEEVVVVY